MKKLSITAKKIIVTVLVVLLSVGTFFLGYGVREWKMNPSAAKLDDILNLIENNYDGEFDRDKFIASAVSGSLDRFSAYFTESEYKTNLEQSQGIKKGKLGISFYTGTNRIYSVEGNSPAEKAGITSGEVIGVKGKDEAEFTVVETSADFLEKYSVFELDEEFFLKIKTCDGVKEYTVKKSDYLQSFVWYQDFSGSYGLTKTDGKWETEKLGFDLVSEVKDGYCFVRFASFYGDAETQMEAVLEKMKSNGIKKIVLDLRQNGGGYLDVLCGITRFFCPGKPAQAVAVAQYKKGSYVFKAPLSANRYGDFGFEKIVLLMSEGTASASEALAGAILDYDEKFGKNIVKIVLSDSVLQNADGTQMTVYRSYGKGIMQSHYKLSDGSVLKMTNAHLTWPVSGKTIHGVGITPDTDSRVVGVKSIEGKDAQAEFAMAD